MAAHRSVMDPDENLSGAFDYEREQWEQELRADPAYVEWLEYIEAMSSQEIEVWD